MMNLKTIATTCLAVSGLAMGQDGLTTSSFPTPSSSSTPSSLAAPRTGLYTGVTKGNAAADNTVDDYTRRPTLIGERQYFAGWGGADLANAAFNFSPGNLNWFGSVLAGGGTVPATLRFGIADGTAWGAGVIVAVDRVATETAGGAESATYYDPSGFGLFGDFNLGGSDVYGQINFNTGNPITPGLENTVITKPAGASEFAVTNHHLNVMAGWKKDATTEGTHALNIEGSYLMVLQSDETPPAPDVEATTIRFTILPSWGYILKSTSDYSVFIGTNGELRFTQFEQGTNLRLAASPNIAIHKQLGKGFEGFSGFSVTGSYEQNSDIPVDNSGGSQLLTGFADVAVGLRWVKDNFAIEGSLKDVVLANGPYLVGGNADQGFFGEVGISLGF